MSIEPENSVFLYNIGVLHNHLKQYEQAIKALGDSVQLNPENTQALLALADSYEKDGQLQKALSVYKRIDLKEHKKVKEKLDSLNAQIKREKENKERQAQEVAV